MKTISLTLPYPPSLNNRWQLYRGKPRINPKSKKYHQDIYFLAKAEKWPRFGNMKLKIHVDVYSPDNRKRDLDNLGKDVWDALQEAKVYDDDYQIVELTYRRKEPVKHGKVVISISPVLTDEI